MFLFWLYNLDCLSLRTLDSQQSQHKICLKFWHAIFFTINLHLVKDTPRYIGFYVFLNLYIELFFLVSKWSRPLCPLSLTIHVLSYVIYKNAKIFKSCLKTFNYAIYKKATRWKNLKPTRKLMKISFDFDLSMRCVKHNLFRET